MNFMIGCGVGHRDPLSASLKSLPNDEYAVLASTPAAVNLSTSVEASRSPSPESSASTAMVIASTPARIGNLAMPDLDMTDQHGRNFRISEAERTVSMPSPTRRPCVTSPSGLNLMAPPEAERQPTDAIRR